MGFCVLLLVSLVFCEVLSLNVNDYIISKLKINPTFAESGSVQVLVPCLSLQSMSTAVRTETLNQNMQLRLSHKPPPTAGAPLVGGGGGSPGVACPVLTTSSASARPDEAMGHRGVSSSSSNSALRENPLTVLLAWMNAKDSHLQHYHDFYLQLGFDVLTVRTLPMQLAFPTSGAQVCAPHWLWLRLFRVIPRYASGS